MNNSLLQYFALLLIILSIGCEDEKADDSAGNLAESGTIYGTITFSGIWPDSGQVLLTLDTSFPPTGPPAKFENLTSEGLADSKYDYSFDNLPFASYGAISVTYWPEDYPNGTYSMLSGYFQAMIVTQNEPELEINLSAIFE